MHQIIDLNIEFERNEVKQSIHPVILKDEHHLILVDTAYPNFLNQIETSMHKNGLRLQDLTHVIVTHHDIDHIGSLRALKDAYPHVKIIATKEESEYISGKKKSLRMVQMEETMKNASIEQKPMYEAFIERLKHMEFVDVDMMVDYDDIIPALGGIQIIHTPGHMPQHISLYVMKEKTVITGDAAVLGQGEIKVSSPQFTLDMEEAYRSLKKLLSLDATRYFCFHGGLYIKQT